MNGEKTMQRTTQKALRVVVAALLAATALMSWAGPSVATGPANTQIAGVGKFDAAGTCTEAPSLFTIKIEGSLQGCWYTPNYDVVQETPSGVYQERGEEYFVGKLYDEDGAYLGEGTFRTTYKFTSKWAADGSEIHGRCQHPIVAGSGTGVFEGATGRVDFKDEVETGCFIYRGHIKLAD